MASKSTTHDDGNTSGEVELSTLSRRQLIREVTDLRWQLGELQDQADREWELVAIRHDIVEREREEVMKINNQLLTQIKALQKA